MNPFPSSFVILPVQLRCYPSESAADFDPSKWLSDIWVVSSNSSQPLFDLTNGSVWSPVLTPDGSAIVFMMSNSSNSPNVYMINTDGSDLQQLTFDSHMMPRSFGIVP